MNIHIRYHIFKKRIKIRFPVIALIVMILVVVIPFFIPLSPDYRPIKSFESTHDYGHSRVGDRLNTQYNVKIAHIDINQYINSEFDVLIINSPDRTFTGKEIQFLLDWMNSGKNIIFLGLSDAIIELHYKLFDLSIDTNEVMIDFNSNHSNVNYVDMEIQGNKIYTGIAPIFQSFNEGQIPITSLNQVELKRCAEGRTTCTQRYTSGIINFNKNYAIILDNWFLRNKFVKSFNENLNVIPALISLLAPRTSNILIDEAHYIYAPLNQRGVEAVLYSLLRTEIYQVVVGFFAVILPFLLGFFTGVIGRDDEKNKKTLGTTLLTRLDRLYLDRIVAAPLSLEEQVLVNEKLEILSRKHNYFQFLAREYLEYIDRKGLRSYVSEKMLFALQQLESQVVSNNAVWLLIRGVNYELEQAKIRLVKAKEEDSYRISIPGIPRGDLN